MNLIGRLIVYSPLAVILIVLALPPAIRERSWKRFFIAVVLSFFGIILPLFIFTASIMLGPEWKGDCRHGWLDCFHVGKLALLPLVLWASAALYAIEIYRTPNRTCPWIVLGVLTGTITSAVCLGIGVIIMPEMPRRLLVPLLVPLYISVWYMIRIRQLLKAAGTNLKIIATALLGNAFFWIVAVIWSRRIYVSLSDKAPNCFIATAAMRGHTAVVGPWLRVAHRGEDRDANQQLRTLWLLEDLWTNRAPRSHARFRRVYNVIGPTVAACITAPFLADLAYLAIKPVEIMARGILKKEERRTSACNATA